MLKCCRLQFCMGVCKSCLWVAGIPLTFTTLWANSADKKSDDSFLIFLRKQILIFHTHCLWWRQCGWNVKTCFLGKIIIKNILKCHLLIFLPRVLSIYLHSLTKNRKWQINSIFFFILEIINFHEIIFSLKYILFSSLVRCFQWVHTACFCGEIRKLSMLFY